MAAAQPGEKDLLIAGDFNLVPSDLAAGIGREVPTSGAGSTLNGSGERTQNLYDHLVVSSTAATAEQIGAAEILDVRAEATDKRTFFRTVSDHLPLVARFRTSLPTPRRHFLQPEPSSAVRATLLRVLATMILLG